MNQKFAYLAIILFLSVVACKKPFNPILATTTTNFLAVDGTIISGDSTFITLSRTTKLSDTTQKKAELKAVVSIENDQKTLFPLIEKSKGIYTLGVTSFDPARTYRLNIKTSDGKIYQSDFVPLKITPPIDSIYFKQDSRATVLFYVNAHDPSNNTRYYRWDYKETWSYVSLYLAYIQYKGGQIVPIIPGSTDDGSTCYRTDLSNHVFVGSSSKLANDVIADQLLGGITAESEKIAHIYVMQLHQYALTKEAFNYYQNLQTNTEDLGTIFDSQPTTTLGNIHCISSPGELVLGFVCASTITSKQFNLHFTDIPLRVANLSYGEWAPFHYYQNYYFGSPDISNCLHGSISDGPYATFASRFATVVTDPNIAVFDYDSFIQSDAPGPSFLEPMNHAGISNTYYYAPKNCVDCRLRGYTNIRPSYFLPF